MTKEPLLLHMCCGPCSEWPLKQLSEEGYKISGYFYNPNIHPLVEQKRRLKQAEALMNIWQLPFESELLDMESQWLGWGEKERDSFSRCQRCYSIRMNRVAQRAAEEGFSAFSTTLLISPYQDQDAIRVAGEKAAQSHHVKFLYRDFRPGFRQAQEMAKEHGLYRQKYCGCILSLEESNFKEKIQKDLDKLTI